MVFNRNPLLMVAGHLRKWTVNRRWFFTIEFFPTRVSETHEITFHCLWDIEWILIICCPLPTIHSAKSPIPRNLYKNHIASAASATSVIFWIFPWSRWPSACMHTLFFSHASTSQIVVFVSSNCRATRTYLLLMVFIQNNMIFVNSLNSTAHIQMRWKTIYWSSQKLMSKVPPDISANSILQFNIIDFASGFL